MEPIGSQGPAAANAVANSKGSATPSQKASPAKSPPLQASPLKESPANGLSGPSTPRTLESESAESEADMREQIEALRAVATQRDGLEKDLKVIILLQDQLQLCNLSLAFSCKGAAAAAMWQHVWQVKRYL